MQVVSPVHGTTSNGGPMRWIMKAIPSKLVFQLLPQTSGHLYQDRVPCARNYLKWWSRVRIMKAIPSKLVFSTFIRT